MREINIAFTPCESLGTERNAGLEGMAVHVATLCSTLVLTGATPVLTMEVSPWMLWDTTACSMPLYLVLVMARMG